MTGKALRVETSRRLFTVDEYERLGQAGILGEDARVELIKGEILQMTPIGSAHASRVNRITRLFIRRLEDRAYVSTQNPIAVSPDSVPQPDIVLARPRTDNYSGGHPTAQDILLIVEVADTSLGYDLLVKAPLYAAAGIRELWVVDLKGARIVIHRQPGPKGYASVQRLGRGKRVAPLAFPDCELMVEEILRD